MTASSEESVVYCSRHSNVETALTCANCGTPICPKCMVVTPVGMKCRDCGTSKGMPLFQLSPGRFVLAGITSMVAGVGANLLSSAGMIFIYFIAVAYGYFMGSMILRASGMKRGLKLEILAGAGMLIGGFGFRILTSHSLFGSIWFLAALGISTACAVSKIRYI